MEGSLTSLLNLGSDSSSEEEGQAANTTPDTSAAMSGGLVSESQPTVVNPAPSISVTAGASGSAALRVDNPKRPLVDVCEVMRQNMAVVQGTDRDRKKSKKPVTNLTNTQKSFHKPKSANAPKHVDVDTRLTEECQLIWRDKPASKGGVVIKQRKTTLAKEGFVNHLGKLFCRCCTQEVSMVSEVAKNHVKSTKHEENFIRKPKQAADNKVELNNLQQHVEDNRQTGTEVIKTPTRLLIAHPDLLMCGRLLIGILSNGE